MHSLAAVVISLMLAFWASKSDLSFEYDHGRGEVREFEDFCYPLIDKKGAFTDYDDCYDEEWEDELEEVLTAAIINKQELPYIE